MEELEEEKHCDFVGRGGWPALPVVGRYMPCPALTVGRTWPALPALSIGYWKETWPGEGSG